MAMSTETPKTTGRTVWDLVFSVTQERRGLYVATAVAWFLILGFIFLVSANYVTVSLKGVTTEAGEPWVFWVSQPANLSTEECDAKAEKWMRFLDGKNLPVSRKGSKEEYWRTANFSGILGGSPASNSRTELSFKQVLQGRTTTRYEIWQIN
jgi:hypothetical protein